MGALRWVECPVHLRNDLSKLRLLVGCQPRSLLCIPLLGSGGPISHLCRCVRSLCTSSGCLLRRLSAEAPLQAQHCLIDTTTLTGHLNVTKRC